MTFYPIDHEAVFDDIEKFKYPNQKVGVIVHIENSKGEILLQKRGINSRDENGLYEYIGGKVNPNDTSFKDAITREIREEAGNDINLKLSNSIGIFHCPKNNTNWIFIIYLAKYIDGYFKIMEPDKCMDYRFFSYNGALSSNEVTKSCKYLIKSIEENVRQ